MAYEPVIEVKYDGAPQAEVLFESFAPGTATVTAWRESGGRVQEVRGAVRAATAGELSRRDTEIPSGPSTYWAEMFDAAGLPLGVTGSTTVSAFYEDTWLHNPLNPAGAVRVQFRPQALRDLSRPVDGAVVHPRNRRVGVVIGSERKGLMGVNLDVVTDTIEDADKVQALLGDYNDSTTSVLCFRIGASDRLRIPSPFFAAVLDIREQDVNYVLGGEQIDHLMTGDEAEPPVPGLFVPLLTRADINAFYSSRAAVAADNTSRGQVNRRYELAGQA